MGRENRTGVYETPQDPELEDILKVFGRKVRLSMRTNTVGTVLSFDPVTQMAKVRVDALEVIKVVSPPPPPPGSPFEDVNLEASSVETNPPIVLPKVPVIIQGSSQGYLSFPIQTGTTGVLQVMDRGIRTWINRLTDVAVDPVQAATHALGDAVFLPGLRPAKDAITPAIDMTAAVLHADTFIKLGRNAALGIARLTDKTSADASMQAWINQVTIALVTMAAQFNISPPGTPMVSLGTGSVIPPTPPSDFGVISTASNKTSSE